MQENDLEKQIKEMMEAYRLSPSASVWEKVKQRIKTRRRRIWPFIVLPVLLLTAVFFIYNNSGSNNTTSPEAVVNDRKDTASVYNVPNHVINNHQLNKNKPGDSLQHTTQVSIHNDVTQPDSFKLRSKKHIYKNSVNNNLNETAFNKKESDEAVSNTVENNYKNKFSKLTDTANSFSVSNRQKTTPDLTERKDSLSAIKNSTVKSDQAKDRMIAILPDTIVSSTIHNNALAWNTTNNLNSSATRHSDSVNHQSVNNKITKAAAAKKPRNNSATNFKWQWGVTALYGRSNTIQSLFHSGADAEKIYNDPSNVTSGFLSRDTIAPASRIFKYSDAFKAGIVLQRRINKNAFLTSGVNYIQLSNKANVVRGFNAVTSLPTTSFDLTYLPQNNSFASASSETYTSIYRFIELPVLWQQYVVQRSKLSLSYNAGFLVMELLSSKALLYNENKNIYFFKKDALRSTQLHLNTGLNLHVPISNKYSFSIGPQINYSLSNTLNKKDYGKYHYIYYGLQASISMHK